MSLLRQIAKASKASSQWSPMMIRCMSKTGREAPIIDKNIVLADPEELAEKEKLQGTITVPLKVDVSPISGVPSDHLKTRRVRIHVPPKNSMQSGTNNLHTWQIDFDNRERWENPLMGWCSTGDPLSNMQINFASQEEAITYCERNGFRWFIDEPKTHKKEKPKSYGVNFAWDKRTRVSTK